jgi:hypothetical protein
MVAGADSMVPAAKLETDLRKSRRFMASSNAT